MPDGVTLPLTGSGDSTAEVATDDAGADGHVQIVKLAVSADGSAAPIAADADGLDVDVVRVADGADVALGATTDAEQTGNGSVIALLKRIRTLLGGTLNVTGTVSVNEPVTVDGSVTVGAALPAGDNNIGNVDVVTMPTVTIQDGGNVITVDGTVSVAEPVTVDGTVSVTEPVSVDDNGGSLTVDAPVGTPVNVQVGDGSAQATVRNLAANDALNVAIVDGAGAHVTAFGGGTQYQEGDTDASITGTAALWEDAGDTLRPVSASTPLPVNVVAGSAAGTEFDEDTPHVSGDAGVMALAVRNDNGATTLTSDDGDYSAIAVDDKGRLLLSSDGGEAPVSVVSWNAGSIGVTNDYDHTEDAPQAASDTGAFVLAVRNDNAATTFTDTDGDYSAIAVTNKGAVHIADGNGSITVDGSVSLAAAIPAGTNNIGDVDILSIAAGDNNIGNVDVVTLPALPAGSNNIGDVDVLSIAAGTNYVGKVRLTDGTLDSSLVDESGTNAVDALAVGGGTPHDSVDSGNPQKIGWKAQNALPTVVANADRVNGIADLWGRQLVSHIDPAMQIWKSVNVTTSQAGTDVWTPASGKKIAITYLAVSAYATTAGRVILWFGANADTTYSAGTDQLIWAGSFVPSSSNTPGVVLQPPVPIFAVTADHEIHLTTDANISLDITVYGYEF
jgi:hypothetical protein